jgi:hypothetical protein
MPTENRTRPCTRAGCPGTQTFKQDASIANSNYVINMADGTIGYPFPKLPAWLCDKNSEHYDLRLPEGTLCDYCKNVETPLTDENSQHIFKRDSEGRQITYANVHRGCAEPWAEAHGGTLVRDIRS